MPTELLLWHMPCVITVTALLRKALTPVAEGPPPVSCSKVAGLCAEHLPLSSQPQVLLCLMLLNDAENLLQCLTHKIFPSCKADLGTLFASVEQLECFIADPGVLPKE